jgi:hypothetical protein
MRAMIKISTEAYNRGGFPVNDCISNVAVRPE